MQALECRKEEAALKYVQKGLQVAVTDSARDALVSILVTLSLYMLLH